MQVTNLKALIKGKWYEVCQVNSITKKVTVEDGEGLQLFDTDEVTVWDEEIFPKNKLDSSEDFDI